MGDNDALRIRARPSRPRGAAPMRGYRAGGRRRPPSPAILIAAVAMLLAAAALLFPELSSEASFEDVRRRVPESDPAARVEGARGINPDTVAWLKVDGTPIDYPVVRPRGRMDRDWYLHHGYDGARSAMGTPYLDGRCDADGPLMLVYAHNDRTGRLFHAVANAEDPKGFDRIGTAHWETSDGETEFEPLFAIRVDRSYAPVQDFTAASDGVAPLIEEMHDEAVAARRGWHDGAAAAGRILALSTCTNGTFGGPERIICVFAAA